MKSEAKRIKAISCKDYDLTDLIHMTMMLTMQRMVMLRDADNAKDDNTDADDDADNAVNISSIPTTKSYFVP